MIIRIRSPIDGIFARADGLYEGGQCKVKTLIARIIINSHDAPYRVIESPVNGQIISLYTDNLEIKKGEIIATIKTLPD